MCEAPFFECYSSYRVPPGAEGGGEDGRAVLGVPGLQAALADGVDGDRVDAVNLGGSYALLKPRCRIEGRRDSGLKQTVD